ncbi:MAG: hypothetical protein ACI97X_002301, partial [Oceanospirillaceae bacterium]
FFNGEKRRLFWNISKAITRRRLSRQLRETRYYLKTFIFGIVNHNNSE